MVRGGQMVVKSGQMVVRGRQMEFEGGCKRQMRWLMVDAGFDKNPVRMTES